MLVSERQALEVGDDRVIARLADRVVEQLHIADTPDEHADPAIVKPRVGDDRSRGAAFDDRTAVAVLGELLLDAIVGPALDRHRAHGPPAAVAIEDGSRR